MHAHVFTCTCALNVYINACIVFYICVHLKKQDNYHACACDTVFDLGPTVYISSVCTCVVKVYGCIHVHVQCTFTCTHVHAHAHMYMYTWKCVLIIARVM